MSTVIKKSFYSETAFEFETIEDLDNAEAIKERHFEDILFDWEDNRLGIVLTRSRMTWADGETHKYRIICNFKDHDVKRMIAFERISKGNVFVPEDVELMATFDSLMDSFVLPENPNEFKTTMHGNKDKFWVSYNSSHQAQYPHQIAFYTYDPNYIEDTVWYHVNFGRRQW